MAEVVVLKTEPRTTRGSRAALKLRKTGKIPAVVYGHKQAAVSLAVSADEIVKAVRRGAHVVDLSGTGEPEKVLIRELQWCHLGKDLLHVDFERVSADERIEVNVPVELRGIAPGALSGAGVLDQPLYTLHIECLAIQIPDSIKVNIGTLQLGQAIHVKELQLPEGVKVLDDEDAVVVQVSLAKPDAAGAVEPTTVEPTLIEKKKKEAEDA